MRKKYAVVVAGGKGLRMNASLPKQFITINGTPVLMRTIKMFHCYDANIEIIVVLPETEISFWSKLCEEHSFYISHKVVKGGETRFYSVQNGLNALGDAGLVAIHDGVRPFVSERTLTNCFDTAENNGNAIPVIEPVDSIRKIDGEHNVPVARADYRLVQTPQVFDVQQLKEAYQKALSTDTSIFTDDASVFSAAGHQICLVQGNRENIKITTSFDLAVAEAVIQSGLYIE